jgi:hypothetical protein
MNTFDSVGFNFDMLCHTYMLRNYKSALIHITTLKIFVKSEICRACEVHRNHKKFILTAVHTLCICNVLAQLHERDLSSSK